MRILAILNQKGGSGKTTTAVNLAATLAETGKKILLIDMDPQGSASRWYGYKDQGKGLFTLLTEEGQIKSIIKRTNIATLDIIPASPILSSAEKILLSEAGAEMVLKEHLEEVKNYDYILIDCPPSLNALSLNALTAAKELLIPVETHVMALHGLVQLIKTIGHVKKRLNPSLKIAGILPCRVDSRTKHAKEVLEQLLQRFEGQVFSTMIRENIKLAEAPLHLKPIIHYDEKCHGSLDYRGLAKEMLKQEK